LSVALGAARVYAGSTKRRRSAMNQPTTIHMPTPGAGQFPLCSKVEKFTITHFDDASVTCDDCFEIKSQTLEVK